MITVRRAYAQTQAMTASRERLMILLFEAAMRHIRLAASALEGNRGTDATFSLARASDIVAEFLATLDKNRAPELAENLTAVYTFVADRLLRAALTHDARLAREAERVLAPVAAGFAEAVKQVEGGSPQR
jgi:flagellar protein FliS